MFCDTIGMLILGVEIVEYVIGVVGVAVGSVGILVVLKAAGSRRLSRAKEDAERILHEARKEGEVFRKEAELEAQKEVVTLHEELDKKERQVQAEIKERQDRLSKREDDLGRKMDALGKKERRLDERDSKLQSRENGIEKTEGEIKRIFAEQREKLLTISGMTAEEAKENVLKHVEAEVQREAGQIVQQELARAEEESRENALRVTVQAIQRFAAENSSTLTVSTVMIPSDDMKGRVIGREGRNIRSFEQTTGVDVIVDDTPGVVVISCFDPIRRAVATEALAKLIEDGRIHPSRIEEVVENTRKEIEERIIKYGKDACVEANIQGLHPKVSEMIGRLYYRTSYGQNILRHSMEVAYLCQVMADELGLDGNMARRCGFLHDIGKAMDHEEEGGHPAIGMEFCRRYKESNEVLNAIGGHHGDIEPISPYTPLVTAADAMSGARPGARRETLEKYVKRLQQLEGIATDFDGVREAYAIQAGREIRVIVDAKKLDDASSAKVSHDIAKRVEEEMTYPGEIRVTVLRELRTIDYAR